MQRQTIAVVALVLALAPSAAQAASTAAIARQVKAAFSHWRAEMFTHGALTFPDEITTCLAAVEAAPDPTKAAYCLALDHFTVVDARATGETLPTFFSDAAVGDRFASTVVAVTPESGRIAYQRQLEIAWAPYDKRLKAQGR